MTHGTHDYQVDPRNEEILINIKGTLFTREQATVSVFDFGYIMGDGVWEGLRLHNGKLFHIDQHLDRLYEAAQGHKHFNWIDRLQPLAERSIERGLSCIGIKRGRLRGKTTVFFH